jgi:hypothetical protein
LQGSLNQENILINFIKFNVITPLQNLYVDSLSFIDNYIKHQLLGPKYLGLTLLKITRSLNKHLNDFNSTIYFVSLDITLEYYYCLI